MVITKGIATTILGDETYTLEPDDVILVPSGIKHMLANRGNEPTGFLFSILLLRYALNAYRFVCVISSIDTTQLPRMGIIELSQCY